MTTQRQKVPSSVRNVLINWGAFVFGVGVNFFVAPFVVRTLGETVYGIWILLASMVGYMGLLDLGVRSAVLRYVAHHHARGEDADAGRAASAGLMIFGVMGVVAILGTAIASILLPRLFTIPAESVASGRIVLVVGGVGVAVSLVSGVFGGALSALQRFDLLGIINIVVGAVRAIALILALRANTGLLGLAFVQLGATALQAVAQYVIMRRLYPQLRLAFGGVQRDQIRKIFSFGMYASLLHVSGALVFSAHAMVIGSYLPVAMITYFSIASTLGDYTRTIVSSISQTITPRASALSSVGALKELEAVVLRSGNAATIITLAITITFIVRGSSFIGFWMGAGFAELSGRILLLLAVSLSFDSARRVVMSALIGLNRHRRLAPFYLAEGILNVSLSIYWIRSLGLEGVALGNVVPNLVTALLVIPWLTREALQTPLRVFWTTMWIRPIVAMLPFAALTYVMEHVVGANGLVSFFASVLATLPAAILGAWLVGLQPADRRDYTRKVRSKFAAFA